jgi:hypothetical protein
MIILWVVIIVTNIGAAIFIVMTHILFNVYGSVHRKYIPVYIQQDATLHSLFYLETALNVSGGTSTHHQQRKQLCLQHLVFVRLLLLFAAITADSSNGLTNILYGFS